MKLLFMKLINALKKDRPFNTPLVLVVIKLVEKKTGNCPIDAQLYFFENLL